MPAIIHRRLAPRPALRGPVADLFVDECAGALERVVMPSPHFHVVIRYGSRGSGDVDVYATGARLRAYRKRVGVGQRVVFAQLAPGALRQLLGAAPRDLAGRVVALSDLWGQNARDQLLERLARLDDAEAAARVLEGALTQRSRSVSAPRRQQLLQAALERLEHQDVAEVAGSLGISPRHLRRIFLDEMGLSPKAYARLRRFDQAVRAAARTPRAGWAAIAADAGYCDQAHLISEFRSIAGAPPRRFMHEVAAQGLERGDLSARQASP